MCFRLAPRSMTLDDLTWDRIFSEFRAILQIWEATTVKGMKVDQSLVKVGYEGRPNPT